MKVSKNSYQNAFKLLKRGLHKLVEQPSLLRIIDLGSNPANWAFSKVLGTVWKLPHFKDHLFDIPVQICSETLEQN